MHSFLGIIGFIALIGVSFLNQPKFGRLPKGERLERIKKSPNYRNGKFYNLSETPKFTSNKSTSSILIDFLFKKEKDVRPEKPIPSIKTDLKALCSSQNVVVWLGHSAYFMKLDGKTFLFDPTLVSASPISLFNKPFKGADLYKPEDIPEIDYLIITHDHWDHLDYETIIQIQNRTKNVITGLGVGEHLEYWGVASNKIFELDWNDELKLEDVTFTCLPARHLSGRRLPTSKTLWASFMIQSPTQTIYISGDGGYDDFFKQIGEKFPHIDLAIMENGQYNNDWKHIHIMPDELPKAIRALNPKKVITGHNSKYTLSSHPWFEPLEKIYENAQKNNFNLLTPKIGEIVNLNDENQTFEKWWSEFIPKQEQR